MLQHMFHTRYYWHHWCAGLQSTKTQSNARVRGHHTCLLQVALGTKRALVGTMAAAVHCYAGTTRKYSLAMPAPILAMELLAMQAARLVRALVVSLANGEGFREGWAWVGLGP